MIFVPPIILLNAANLEGALSIPHLQFFGFGIVTAGVPGVLGVARKHVFMIK